MIISAKVIPGSTTYEVYSRQAQGVVRGHKDYILSRSEIMRFADCPEKWLTGIDDDSDTKATLWGRLVECLEMSPELFKHQFAVIPPTYCAKGMECPSCKSVTDSAKCAKCKCDRVETTIEKEWNKNADVCQKWEESKKGFTLISETLMEAAHLSVVRAMAYEPRVQLVASSDKQVMVVGIARIDGFDIPLRCLIDLVPREGTPYADALADSKTARNGNPDVFARVIDDSGYDIQAALSIDLFQKATGRTINDWIFPLQENMPPYHVVKPMPCLSSEYIAYGREKYQNALRFYAQCLSTDTWPSYPTKNRLCMGNVQIIGPDDLWSYKQTAGQGARLADRQPEAKYESNTPS